MVRNVVLVQFKPGVRDQDVAAMLEAMREIRTPGLLSITAGRDLGLREGNWHAAVVTDLADQESYRIYDADPEHNHIRRDLVAPLVDRIVRCQFEV